MAAGSDDMGSGIGAGIDGAALLTRTVFFLTTFFTAFLATGFLAGAFLDAALAVFFTAFFALLDTLDLLDVFAGRVFFFKTFFFAPERFAFATGRCFALVFFFAMISLLAVLRLRA